MIESFTINGEKDYYSYAALIGRIASVSYDSSNFTLAFLDENENIMFSVDLSSLEITTDNGLTEEGKPADAKKVGDELTTIRESIPSVDNTLSVPNQAAESKTVGDAIRSLNNATEGLEGDIGLLNDLETSEKNNLVEAINSLVANVATVSETKEYLGI